MSAGPICSNANQDSGSTPSSTRAVMLLRNQVPSISMPSARWLHKINSPIASGTPTAHRNTLERAQLDTSSSQPTVGKAHSRYTGSRPTRRNGDTYKSSWDRVTPNTLVPCISSTMPLIVSSSSDSAMQTPNTINGATTSAVAAFDNTVMVSDTGSDFQNSMLRSRRSSCSAPRQ